MSKMHKPQSDETERAMGDKSDPGFIAAGRAIAPLVNENVRLRALNEALLQATQDLWQELEVARDQLVKMEPGHTEGRARTIDRIVEAQNSVVTNLAKARARAENTEDKT